MTSDELRVAVVGAGRMGADHIRRVTRMIAGARVTAIVEPDAARAGAAAALAPGSRVFAGIEDALASGEADAVIVATPGRFHEPVLLPAIAAGVPILCEKPLTEDPASSLAVVEAEQRGGRRLVQVGFMRRFDRQYRALKALIAGGEAGELLMLHGVHRNASVPADYTQRMLITDSVVHELDVMPWLAGSPLVSIEVRRGRRSSLAPERLTEPILVLLQLANGVLVDVELSVSAQFGYQVGTEAVLERGVARIGETEGLSLRLDGRFGVAEHPDFTTRFADAYDVEVQAWADAARAGGIAGPSAWDGYRAALACEAGVRALEQPGVVAVETPAVPSFYAAGDAASG